MRQQPPKRQAQLSVETSSRRNAVKHAQGQYNSGPLNVIKEETCKATNDFDKTKRDGRVSSLS